MRSALVGPVLAAAGCAATGGHASGTMHCAGGVLGSVDVVLGSCTGSVERSRIGTTLVASLRHQRRGGHALSIFQGPDFSGGTVTRVSASSYSSPSVDVAVDAARCARHDVSIGYDGGVLRAAVDLDCDLPDGAKLRAVARADECQITQLRIGS